MTVETEQSVKGRATDKIDVQIHSEPSLKKDYVGEITLRVSELPALKPRVLPTRSRSAWRRFIEAGQRRTFTLTKNFYIEVEGEALPPGIEGCIVIPTVGKTATVEEKGKPLDESQRPDPATDAEANVFDGASVPLPWLVSYLSFGVLRPLGILLSASVVHDFAFQFGYLPIVKNGKCKNVPLQRHDADELFRLITQTLNGSNFWSRLAWHAVRLGWWGLEYAGQRFTGERPTRSSLLAIASVAGAYALGVLVRNTVLAEVQSDLLVAAGMFGLVGIALGIVYLWIALESYFRLPDYYKEAAASDETSL